MREETATVACVGDMRWVVDDKLACRKVQGHHSNMYGTGKRHITMKCPADIAALPLIALATQQLVCPMSTMNTLLLLTTWHS